MTFTVVGLFDNRSQAQAAAQELAQQGFIRENIDVSNRRIDDVNNISTQVTITESGISDRIGNFFNSLFGDDKQTAGNYASAAGAADAILSIQVDTAERARAAAEILDRHGAIDVDARASRYNHLGGQQNYASPSGLTGASAPNAAIAGGIQGETTIPIIEEQLQVGKQVTERGVARVRSRIIERPVEEHIRLREEHVVIDRRPVDREVTSADLASFQEGEIVLTEHAEIPVVGKQTRVVEEVVIGKQVEEHDQIVRDTVRRTDVEVEQIDEEIDTVVRNRNDLNTRGVSN
jgi:uncharacterized protein (TIGR02271 family)